jgi:hypothetical protein
MWVDGLRCRLQGKSFILNQLLQITGGFQIGSTTRPCTKGLWMWSTPQRRLDDTGRQYHIVSSTLTALLTMHSSACSTAHPSSCSNCWVSKAAHCLLTRVRTQQQFGQCITS